MNQSGLITAVLGLSLPRGSRPAPPTPAVKRPNSITPSEKGEGCTFAGNDHRDAGWTLAARGGPGRTAEFERLAVELFGAAQRPEGRQGQVRALLDNLDEDPLRVGGTAVTVLSARARSRSSRIALSWSRLGRGSADGGSRRLRRGRVYRTCLGRAASGHSSEEHDDRSGIANARNAHAY